MAKKLENKRFKGRTRKRWLFKKSQELKNTTVMTRTVGGAGSASVHHPSGEGGMAGLFSN